MPKDHHLDDNQKDRKRISQIKKSYFRTFLTRPFVLIIPILSEVTRIHPKARLY